jgi:predicted transposase/invertase (TIGR01784 family)
LILVNREYKNSVFSLLFGDPETLREVYSALEGITIDPAQPIIINTLEDALYMKRINDLSFTIGEKLVVLIEHQSTLNKNMPLRILMYIARIYEKIVENKDIYARNLIKIPRPEFLIIYNGPDTNWDIQRLKLSDAFEDASILGISSAPAPLELTAIAYNINQGHNKDMVCKSEKLSGYSIFINKVREYENESGNLEEAIKKAVKYCVENNILKKFLETHSKEVSNMLFTEWNQEEALEYRYKEGWEGGEEEGHKEDAKNFLAMGIDPEKVAQGTGLPIEIVKELASTLGTKTAGK